MCRDGRLAPRFSRRMDSFWWNVQGHHVTQGYSKFILHIFLQSLKATWLMHECMRWEQRQCSCHWYSVTMSVNTNNGNCRSIIRVPVNIKVTIITNSKALGNVHTPLNCLLPAFFEIKTNLCSLVCTHLNETFNEMCPYSVLNTSLNVINRFNVVWFYEIVM
jgi:hypothetical protein